MLSIQKRAIRSLRWYFSFTISGVNAIQRCIRNQPNAEPTIYVLWQKMFCIYIRWSLIPWRSFCSVKVFRGFALRNLSRFIKNPKSSFILIASKLLYLLFYSHLLCCNKNIHWAGSVALFSFWNSIHSNLRELFF